MRELTAYEIECVNGGIWRVKILGCLLEAYIWWNDRNRGNRGTGGGSPGGGASAGSSSIDCPAGTSPHATSSWFGAKKDQHCDLPGQSNHD